MFFLNNLYALPRNTNMILTIKFYLSNYLINMIDYIKKINSLQGITIAD